MLVQKIAPTENDISKILSLSTAKSFMRIVGDDDNDDIQSMILGAIKEGEDCTNRQFATSTFELYLETFKDELQLPKNPIASIEKIEVLDVDMSYKLLDDSSYYFYEKNEVGTIVFTNRPTTLIHKKAVKITFTSGYGEYFPEDLRSWLKVRVSTLFEFREEIYIGATVNKTEHIDKILNRYKIRGF